MINTYDTIIGLEVHVELSTKTKIFCGCSTEFGGEPNSHTCPVCLGLPGTLPVLNKDVVFKAIKACLALNCEVNEVNIFDRKNYFYPDLPKDYQTSQLYEPIGRNGYVDINVDGKTKRVRIHELHMEEDAGKLVHEGGATLVDYNRCGVPLIEIVSEPDLENAKEVSAYLEALREILGYLDVSDCRMEEGSMRADVNLSVKPQGSEALGTRTETKNMNSIKAIGRAIESERERQIALISSGGRVTQETRRWDDNTGESTAMRSKEDAQDYRYFPEPDLLKNKIDAGQLSIVAEHITESAAEKRARYTSEYKLPDKTAIVLTYEKKHAEFFEGLISEMENFSIKNALSFPLSTLAKEAASIVTGEILRLEKELDIKCEFDTKLTADIAYVLVLVLEGKLDRSAGREIVANRYKSDFDIKDYIKQNSLLITEDKDNIRSKVLKALSENEPSVKDYLAGKEKAISYLIGQSMRLLKGQALPQTVNEILIEELKIIKDKNEQNADSAGTSITRPSEASRTDNAECEMQKGKATPNPPTNNKNITNFKKTMQNSNTGTNPEKHSSAPLAFSGRYRDMTCAEINSTHIGKQIKLAGFIRTIRNHGGIVFLDLYDQYGVSQIVVTDEQVQALTKESSISVQGKVVARSADTINKSLATGEVELVAETIELTGKSKNALPFEIDSSRQTNEELRLRYRYLDLRNDHVRANIILRAQVIKKLREEMDELGFVEIQTPILANSSPEGARDYLVPSRKHKGKFYALPQAPQQFKQLLMVSSIDKYYQIAPCFRDEDSRLDRSPGEFYQLDFEMAFATQEDVFAVAQRVLYNTFKMFTNKHISKPPFVRIPFEDAMLKYGTDKPDLRNPLKIIDLSEFFETVDFAPFRGKIVRAIRVPNGANNSKRFFKEMEKFAISIGMKGLGYISVEEDLSFKGPIDKFMTDEQKEKLTELAGLTPGDVLYFISDAADRVAKYAGQIRSEVAKRMDIIDKDRFEFCYIVDFPMYEFNEDEQKIDFTHNPFSMPQGELDALENQDPLTIKAYQYDIVVNGVELSSGAVRNHRPDIMVKAFEIAGYSEQVVAEKFGALYTAFGYGAPPHAGMAPGLDRIVMLLAGEENIREIIAYPLNSNAQNLMLDAPGEVSENQLREVHIKIR